jgi:hypothetical protein
MTFYIKFSLSVSNLSCNLFFRLWPQAGVAGSLHNKPNDREGNDKVIENRFAFASAGCSQILPGDKENASKKEQI